MSRVRRVAVLGAGIMGSSVALLLGRRGVQVTVFDQAPLPFAGASRWNEGKIHLGYLYAADPSLATARRVLPGGLAFRRLVESLIGCPLDPAISGHDDTYLVHRDSVVDAAAFGHYVAAVCDLCRETPGRDGYLSDLRRGRARRLTHRELEADYDARYIAAGFRVPERSVSTTWVADRFTEALAACPAIALEMGTRVGAVVPIDETPDARLKVQTGDDLAGPFDAVVNALWEGRLAVDAGLGIRPEAAWSHRYRLSVFMRARRPLSVPSTVIAVGPFGDVKNYNGRDYHLSWYAAGLVAEGDSIHPPQPPGPSRLEHDRIAAEVLDRLGDIVTPVRALAEEAEEIRVEGGWVYALGQGSLADPSSRLHRRDRVGIHRRGRYFSVDTGKYSIAPWLAESLAEEIC